MPKMQTTTATVTRIDHAATGQVFRQLRQKRGLSLRSVAARPVVNIASAV